MQEENKDVLGFKEKEVIDQLSVEEPLYKGSYGDFSWQQERILCFGKSKAFSIFTLLQIVSFAFAIYQLIDLIFFTEAEVGAFTYVQMVIGIIFTFIILYGIIEFRVGSRKNDIKQAKSGITIFQGVYQFGYVIGVISLVVSGVVIFLSLASVVSYLAFIGVQVLFPLLIVAVVFGLAIIKLIYLKRVVEFCESMLSNICATTTNFEYGAPKISKLKPFIIIVIVMWLLAIIGLALLQTSEVYKEVLPMNDDMITLYISLIFNVGLGVFTLYMLKEFNHAMKFNLK